MQDTVDLPVAFLGALYAGIVPVPVNTLLPADDYAYMLGHSRRGTVLVSAALLPTVQQAHRASRARSPRLRRVRRRRHAGRRNTAMPSFASLLARRPLPDGSHADTHADDFAFWLYSSGSTGRPKGTVHSHANLYWTAELYGKPVLGLREDDVVLLRGQAVLRLRPGQRADLPARRSARPPC